MEDKALYRRDGPCTDGGRLWVIHSGIPGFFLVTFGHHRTRNE